MNPAGRHTVFTARRLAAGAVLLAAIFFAVKYLDVIQAAAASNPIPSSPQSVSRGQRLWKQDCEVCHGAQGRGDGPVTASLAKRPKDLTKIARPPIFPDGVLAYRITNGGEVMPAWKSVLTPEETWDIVNFIRAQRR
jgi:mono/diheme cytochrome c family protein